MQKVFVLKKLVSNPAWYKPRENKKRVKLATRFMELGDYRIPYTMIDSIILGRETPNKKLVDIKRDLNVNSQRLVAILTSERE